MNGLQHPGFPVILALTLGWSTAACQPRDSAESSESHASRGDDGTEGGDAGSVGSTGRDSTDSQGEDGTAGETGDPPDPPPLCSDSTPGSRLLRRLTRRELMNTQIEVFGDAAANAETNFPSDPVDRIRLSNDASILDVTQDVAQALLDRAEEIAAAVTEPEALAASLPCAADTAGAADDACASSFIDAYGSALFRRPLTEEDRERYLTLFRNVSSASDFATGLEWTLVALQQSPYTVYRSELGTGDGRLTPYEVASALAYDYSASPPSAELVAMAVRGELDDPDVRFEQAKQLLQTPRGTEVVRQFFEEWLNYRDVLTVSRSNTPENFETVRPKMALETERFLAALVYEKSGTLADLLTADFTFADQELATYYGFAGGTGDMHTDGGVEVPRAWGVGVFAQGAVTTAMASIEVTSPTRRGLLLLRRLYCEVPGVPEGLNFDLTDERIEGNTTRERLENSHLQPDCQTCHQRFDPLGFGFEHIDHIGRYREHEVTPAGSFPIDATAVVALLGGAQIDGQEELMHGLAGDPKVLSCVSGTMTRYVYGSEGECRAASAATRVMNGETSILDFLAELAREPHFVQRSE